MKNDANICHQPQDQTKELKRPCRESIRDVILFPQFAGNLLQFHSAQTIKTLLHCLPN
jgi:hypothetical protein